MTVESFVYEGCRIKIIEKLHASNTYVHYILVNDKVLSFVKDKAYAISIAKRYVDVILDEYYMVSRNEGTKRNFVPRPNRQRSGTA